MVKLNLNKNKIGGKKFLIVDCCRHKGTVHEVFEGTSVVSVTLDDGKTSNVDLGKQGIRFYSQKRRW